MNKLRMITMCLFAMMVSSLSVKAQEVTITLFPGWNWISYPNAVSMEISEALGTFTPMNGDKIKAQFSNSSYNNGYWRGGVTHFMPGMGYMYYSSRSEVTSFVFAATSNSMVMTSTPTDITATTAMVGSTVTIGDGNHIFARGVCWGTNPNPDIDGSHTTDATIAGSLSDTLTELTSNTIYYVRAYAVTDYGLAYGEEMSFTTLVEYQYVDLGLPSGTLWATFNVGANAPEQYGDYFAWGETQPKEYYGWSTYQYCNGSESTLTKYCTNSSYGYNGFTDNLTTLLPEDDAATANLGNDWRVPSELEWQELIDNTSSEWVTQNGVEGYLLTASNGNSLFLPAAGCRYENDLNGAGQSDGLCYWSGLLNIDHPSRAWATDLWANFSGRRFIGYSVRPVRAVPQNASFIIDATANPAEGGEVSGAGTYQEGTECTLTATPNEGYTFTNWTENGEVASTEVIYSFTVNGNRTLVANFIQVPIGAIAGLFTVNSNGDQVYFSQGNLQYIGSAGIPYWRFAEHQWQFLGNNGQGSINQNVDRDLFGWGTSGWNCGNNYYRPWNTDNSNGGLYGPCGQYNLTGSYINSDWGVYNRISNGGNQTGIWRTLTKDEWQYVLFDRNTNIHFAKARVNDINGLIILPDNWDLSTFSLNNTDQVGADFDSNTISETTWNILESNGAVFLPDAGERSGTSLINFGMTGFYWTSSFYNNEKAYCLTFGSVSINGSDFRFNGLSVRLVCSAE